MISERQNRRGRAGFPQNLLAKWNDKAGFLGEWNELRRRNEPQLRMAPARQSLHAERLPANGVDDRLKMNFKLIAEYRRTKVALQMMPHLGVLGEPSVEKAVAIAAFRFSPIERKISLFHQVARFVAIGGSQRNADGDAHGDVVAADIEWLRENLDNALGKSPGGLGRMRCISLNDGELVTAKPCQNIGLSDRAPQSFGRLLQQFVTGGVAERVVDLLEAVEVEHKNREGLALWRRPPIASATLSMNRTRLHSPVNRS